MLPADLRLGQIEDISMVGLSFCYVPMGEPMNPSDELEIYSVDKSFHLKRIPFRTVSDDPVSDNIAFCYVPKRRHSVKFGSLTEFQRGQLFAFIRTYTEKGSTPATGDSAP